MQTRAGEGGESRARPPWYVRGTLMTPGLCPWLGFSWTPEPQAALVHLFGSLEPHFSCYSLKLGCCGFFFTSCLEFPPSQFLPLEEPGTKTEQVELAPENRMDKELARKTVSGVLVDGCFFLRH